MTAKSPRSATNPDQARQADHVAVNDRKASPGDDYARDNNRSAEGNDASLTSGPAFERRVRADGSVEGVAPPTSGADEVPEPKAPEDRTSKDA